MPSHSDANVSANPPKAATTDELGMVVHDSQ